MKNLTKYIILAVIIILGFSCDKNESVVLIDGKCGNTKAKFIRNWCASDNGGLVEILSNNNIGEDWVDGTGKTYHHAVNAAILDSTLLKNNVTILKVMNQSDSIFYLNYYIGEFMDCKMCCPPTQKILITSLASKACMASK